MPYSVQRANATTITVADGDVNSESTSLSLIGKNYPSYGVFLNQNFVRLLENFAHSAAPGNPSEGQLWYDNGEKLLKVYSDGAWKVISSAMAEQDPPSNAVTGDLWWDPTDVQLKVFPGGTAQASNRDSWVTIGPSFSRETGTTGAIAAQVFDSNGEPHSIIQFFVENRLVGIFSKDTTFTPEPAIAGFDTIKPGHNLSDDDTQASRNEGSLRYNGVAEAAAALIDGTTVIEAGNIARTNQSNRFDAIQYIDVNDGLRVGDSGQVDLKVTSTGATPTVDLMINDNSYGLRLGVAATTITVSAGGGIVLGTGGGDVQVGYSTNPTNNTSVAHKKYVDDQVGLSLDLAGTRKLTGNILPNATGTVNLGGSTSRFNVIYANSFDGTAIRAQYADLAERFEADSSYTPGTVVELGGPAEITKVGQELSENVFGVISTRAAYLMNAGAGDDTTHPPVAVSGRVPVRVTGKVRKGDRLVSAGNGLARAAQRDEMTPWNVIGRALENKETNGEGVVEAIVKLNS